MDRITFTREDREIMVELLIRPGLVLRKMLYLTRSMSPDVRERRISLDEFLGRGHGQADYERIASIFREMPLVMESWDFGERELRVLFRQDAMSVVCKIAMQEDGRDTDGTGDAYGGAMLALKRAFGGIGDVWWFEGHGYENFDFGESISYLDEPFKWNRWWMTFDCPQAGGLKREIMAMPDERGMIGISQRITGKDAEERKIFEDSCLVIVSRSAFINPSQWRWIAEAVEAGNREWERIAGK